MSTPQQKPLETQAAGKKVRPESRIFVVRGSEEKPLYITLASFFRNKNNKLSGKANLRYKDDDGSYKELDEITIRNGEFINLASVQ